MAKTIFKNGSLIHKNFDPENPPMLDLAEIDGAKVVVILDSSALPIIEAIKEAVLAQKEGGGDIEDVFTFDANGLFMDAS
jgi:hypothetical protein